MFFVLAKVLWFLLQPSSLMVGAALAGAALAGTRWRRTARVLLWGAGAAVLICGLSPLSDMLTQPLENRFRRADLEHDRASIAGIIVLGGAEDTRSTGRPELAGLSDAAERYIESIVLARRLPGARLVFAGGSGALMGAELPEAEMARRVFEALGVDPARLTLEPHSRDTYENAVFAARILNPRPDQRWLLVTSAAHMPRAIGCFRRAGFAVEAWPVDYRTPRRLSLMRLNASLPDGLARMDAVTREYVGLVAYYLAGRTSALFPGP
jgi:uncharacterized SAM-binding protein YcdF (DUF218 family)